MIRGKDYLGELAIYSERGCQTHYEHGKKIIVMRNCNVE